MQPIARVVANPYHCLDHKGRPAGAVLRLGDIEYRDDTSHPDPIKHTWQPRMYVGATLEAKEIHRAEMVRMKGQMMVARPAVHDRTWTFSTDPVCLDISSPQTRTYYKRHVDDGGMFAADVASWVAFGNKAETFREPIVLLAEAKAFAIKTHQDNHGVESVPQSTHEHFADVLPKPKGPGQLITVDFAAKRSHDDLEDVAGEA